MMKNNAEKYIVMTSEQNEEWTKVYDFIRDYFTTNYCEDETILDICEKIDKSIAIDDLD